ncbi:MAG TPA: copper-binding protein [Candidatus Bathyarchaeia archaeon]|nr:copper-binding protein [Candidatus Bathyarchaeia archaeon]
MRLWRAVVLLNVSVAVGILLGWIAWGREVSRLERQLLQSQQRVLVVGTEREWVITGVVRTVIPEIQVVVLTHEEIPGFMPAGMTMGFKARDPKLLEPLRAGDVVRFTLKGVPPDVQITAVTVKGRS